jgi:TonB-dependent starch-binding outer membrane protein SusC
VPINPATGLRYRATNSTGADYFFRAGDPIFTDLNGDYVLDKEDLVVAGNSRPLITGGFGATIQYKGWSVQPNLVFSLKRDIINNAAADMFRGYYDPAGINDPKKKNGGALVPLNEFDYWTPSHIAAAYPNPFDFRRASIINPYRYNSTLFQEDGSYVKLGSTTVSYNFDREMIRRKLGITALRVYFNANNIYTWSKYSGPDPELVTDLGYDNSSGYPRSREFTFGIDLQF